MGKIHHNEKLANLNNSIALNEGERYPIMAFGIKISSCGLVRALRMKLCPRRTPGRSFDIYYHA